MNEVTVAKLIEFKIPMTDAGVEKLREYCENTTDLIKPFGVATKGKQVLLTRSRKPRVVTEDFIDDVNTVCEFLSQINPAYGAVDSYEVDY